MNGIKGRRFSQRSLSFDLQEITAGQTSLNLFLLFCTAIVLVCISACFSSYVGIMIGFRTIYVDLQRLVYATTSAILLIYVFTLLYNGFRKSVLISTISLVFLLIVTRFLAFIIKAEISSIYEFAVLTNILVNGSVLVISFLSISFSTALLKTIFSNKFLIIVSTLIINFAIALSSSTFSIAVGLLDGQTATHDFSSLSSIQVFVTLLCGVGMSFGLVLCGFVENRLALKWLPHETIKSLRQWSIALVSWGGTSFYGLDLSKIDFTGATIAHTDFRGSRFYRTCLKDVKGLDRARVDDQFFDLAVPKVQELLTTGSSKDRDFSRVNLRGAYLHNADLRYFNLSEANLDAADLSDADLRDSILVRSILTSADLSRVDLTGACIQDWSFNDQTCLTDVRCDYVYREFQNNQPVDRYPSDRNFEPGEFESLFQKLTNAVELVFRDQVDWRALTFTFEKFRLEDDGMDLELKGIEQRGDYWIVKVTHREGVTKQQVEQQVQSTYGDLRAILEAKDQQINRLLGIVEHQTGAMQQQAEALTNFSKQPFGNNFNIFGSTITNLAGSGQIEYQEASTGVRSLVTNPVNPDRTLQQLIYQLTYHNVATTAASQGELIQQVLLAEAEHDPAFRAFLLEQGQQVIDRLPDGEIAIALQTAIRTLQNV